MIIPRHEYDRMKYEISEARTVIEMKNDMIDSQKELIYDLIEENKALKEALRSKTVYVDFPNSDHKAKKPGDIIF